MERKRLDFSLQTTSCGCGSIHNSLAHQSVTREPLLLVPRFRKHWRQSSMYAARNQELPFLDKRRYMAARDWHSRLNMPPPIIDVRHKPHLVGGKYTSAVD